NIIVEDERGQKAFRFQPGPVFTNLLLADEINRATPKTQSALLEAMQEHQGQVAGRPHPAEGGFFVSAPQTPTEMEGTYPLPEPQLDRFVYKLMIGYPGRADLIEVMRRTTADQDLHASRVLTPDELLEMRKLSREVILAHHLEEMAA